MRALDRYTLRFTLEEPRPRFLETSRPSDLFGAVAREVVEFYGDQIEAHPVGTGPFSSSQWRRSSLIVLERNPDFREMFYDAEPAADDAEGQALLARFKGRRLPMVDRVEISIIEEEQPRWLAFVNGEADVAYRVGYQFAPQAMPGGKVAPNLAKRGIRGYRDRRAGEPRYYLFNMDDPVVGGYSAGAGGAAPRDRPRHRHRARDHAYALRGQAIAGAVADRAAHHRLRPDAARPRCGDYDPARARPCSTSTASSTATATAGASSPTARRCVLRCRHRSRTQRSRKIDELWKKNMKALGIRVELKIGAVAGEPEGGARRQAT